MSLGHTLMLILAFILAGCGGAPRACSDHENTGWFATGVGSVAALDTVRCASSGESCMEGGIVGPAAMTAAAASIAAFYFYNASECHEREGEIRGPVAALPSGPPAD